MRVWIHNTYVDIVDSGTGALIKDAIQVELEVVAGLIGAGIGPVLADRIKIEGGKPLADGNLLHELVQKGLITPATVVDLLTAATGGGSAHFPLSQLQKKYKHAGDFGVAGPANMANLSMFAAALAAHFADPGVIAISGVYLKNPVTMCIHPDTNLAVIVDDKGIFRSGWKLSPQQFIYGLILARLGGRP